jgi:photosystem II stability/assembly factor-like uncharacterized protein
MDFISKNKLFKLFITIFYFFSVLIFFVALNFKDNPGGWQLQYLPNLNGQPISDVTFLDSLTGFIVTNDNTAYDTGYILKTTNAGINWSFKFSRVGDFSRIIFVNSLIGYTCGGTGSGTSYLYKTTNQGENWFISNSPATNFWNDMFILNQDTIWLVDGNGLLGGLFRSTNGGLNWIQQFSQFNQNPDKIYMVNKNLGFIRRGDSPFGAYIGRTTDGGFNWTLNTNADTTFDDMYFIDSITGYKCDQNIQKTTDGGLTWTWQILPHLNFSNTMLSFSFINKDTIFGVGGVYQFPSAYRGLVYKTANGGINWGYQIPDTSFGITQLWYIKFINSLKGWAFRGSYKNIYTNTGGSDTTLYTRINNKIISVPINFELKQNYPNPYNLSTIIEYYINKQGFVKLKIFDMIGKEFAILVNEVQYIGGYGIPVSINLSSGVYFYRLQFISQSGDIQIETRKMIVIK